MKRAKPPQKLIRELCAGYGKAHFIGSVHNGVAEVSLQEAYPFLDLTEVLTFAAASRQLRKFHLSWTRSVAQDAPTLYDIFRQVYSHEITIFGHSMEEKQRNV